MTVSTDSHSIYIPIDFADNFSEIVMVGIKNSKLSRAKKEEILQWWKVEKELMVANENSSPSLLRLLKR